MMEEVGDSIRRLRLQRNLSQETVAERSGISFGAYRHLESGELRTLPPPMISPMEILKRESRMPRQRASAVRKGGRNG